MTFNPTTHKLCPFRIVVDSNEQIPWTFVDMRADHRDGAKLFFCEFEKRQLGYFDNGEYIPRGDYTIDGMEDFICIERKSASDLCQTLLGWDNRTQKEDNSRRLRFERQLREMRRLPRRAVVVEGTLADVLREVKVNTKNKRSPEKNAKILLGTMLSWTQKYPVPFYFAETRRWAEAIAFRLMYKAYNVRAMPHCFICRCWLYQEDNSEDHLCSYCSERVKEYESLHANRSGK